LQLLLCFLGLLVVFFLKLARQASPRMAGLCRRGDEREAAFACLKSAVEADNAGRAAEALGRYMDGIAVLMEVCRTEPDDAKRAQLLQELNHFMERAEQLKAAQPSALGKLVGYIRGGASPATTAKPKRSASAAASTTAARAPAAAAAAPAKRSASLNTRPAPRTTPVRQPAARPAVKPSVPRQATAAASSDDKRFADLERIILDDLLDSSPGVRWDDIAGLAEAKQTLQEAVILPHLR
jgi:SpoVK/Ycf46/Vps4 family AAA+-type ATPase